ncbi:hypothetical protein APPUASWS_001105, partial [Arthrospira platensis str. Paraca]
MGTTADVSTNGGTTAYSGDTATATITINPVNDAPVLDNSQDIEFAFNETLEATPPTGEVGWLISEIVTLGENVTDVDSDPVTGIAITALDETNGTWYYSLNNGTEWTAVGAVSDTSALLLPDNPNTRLFFSPNANFRGTVNNSITFRAWDQTFGNAGDSENVSINGGTTAFSAETDTITIIVEPLPRIASVSVPTANNYGIGQELEFTVTFSQAVTISGEVSLPITLDTGGVVNAALVGDGSSATTHSFRYTVAEGDEDLDGIEVGAELIVADGATIVNSNGMSAVLTLNAIDDTTAILVDGIAPDAPTITTTGATKDTTPEITGTAEPGSTVEIFLDGTSLGTATADDSGNWTFTPATALAEGEFSFTASATDAAGNTSDESTTVSLTVDTSAPDAPEITTSDITNGVIEGTAEPGSTVEVFLDGNSIGTATADGDGNWTFTPATALAEGEFSFTASATDAAGNTSDESTTVSLTVDTSAPDAPEITTSDITNGVIEGTAEPGSTVEVFLDGNSIGTATADGDGNWTFTPATALAEGEFSFTASATDAAGNTSDESTTVSLTVDTSAPDAPEITTSDITNGVIEGTAEPGSTVEVFLDGNSIGTATADGDGNWTFTPATALAEGEFSFTASATDAAGNTSDESTTVSLTVDTSAPDAPEITTSDITNGVIEGTAEPGSTVEVFLDGNSIGTATADGDGNWTFTPATALAEGEFSFTASATDAAGNTSDESTTVSLTVDTSAPDAPEITTSDITNGVIEGTAEPGSTVEVFLDGNSIGTATADGDGNWTFTPATALAEGEFSFTASATDAAGNTSDESTTVSLTVDTSAPDAPEITTSDITNGVIEGTAEPGSTVEVFLDGNSIGTATADDS